MGQIKILTINLILTNAPAEKEDPLKVICNSHTKQSITNRRTEKGVWWIWR